MGKLYHIQKIPQQGRPARMCVVFCVGVWDHVGLCDMGARIFFVIGAACIGISVVYLVGPLDSGFLTDLVWGHL